MNRAPRTPPSSEAASLAAGEQSSAALSVADEKLEQAIEATRLAMLGAVSRDMKRDLAEQMRILISQRSPWKIAQMEREQGLR